MVGTEPSPGEHFSSTVRSINRWWGITVVGGCIVGLVVAFLIYGMVVWTWKPKLTSSGGATELPYLSLLEDNLPLLTLAWGGAFVAGWVLASLRRGQQLRRPVRDLFALCDVRLVKELRGEVEVAPNQRIEVEWDAPFFALRRNGELLSLAKPSELYWRILYWLHKMSP